MTIDRKSFFDEVRGSVFGSHLSQRQVEGMEPVLDAWDKTGWTDVRWLAYVFATVRGEDGAPMYPVKEVGEGKGHPYGVPGVHSGQVPFGRGYIQTTWDSGYEKTDKGLAAHGVIKAGELLANFDLLLRPEIAAPTILYGMAEGWYTKFKLSDYLNDHKADFLNCRRIVNGMDKASEFAGWAQQFNTALIAASRKAADKTQVTVKGPAPQAHDLPQDVLSGLLKSVNATLGQLVQPQSTAAAGPPLAQSSASPPVASPAPAAQPLANEGNVVMEILPVLMQLFLGVSGKLSAAGAVATVAPKVISGALGSVSEIPTVVTEIEKLVTDFETGKWADVPNAAEALLGEFTKILGNFGVQLPVLNGLVGKMVAPATQAGSTIAQVS